MKKRSTKTRERREKWRSERTRRAIVDVEQFQMEMVDCVPIAVNVFALREPESRSNLFFQSERKRESRSSNVNKSITMAWPSDIVANRKKNRFHSLGADRVGHQSTAFSFPAPAEEKRARIPINQSTHRKTEFLRASKRHYHKLVGPVPAARILVRMCTKPLCRSAACRRRRRCCCAPESRENCTIAL